MTDHAASQQNSARPGFASRAAAVWLVVALYAGLTLPYAFTKLNGDEAHFVTIPYLMLGGDYSLSALKQGEYSKAASIAFQSYALAWRYFVRPADAHERSAQGLAQYRATSRAAGREKPFVFTPDYFVTHRKGGKPLLCMALNVPALGVTYLLPRSLLDYQRDFIYHPAFLAPRLSVWLLGIVILLLVHRIARERAGPPAGFRAALIFAVLPITVVWTADLHLEVPLTLFLLLFFYFLWKGKTVWAALCWGLAFGAKNQAIFALAPILAEGLWQFLDPGTLGERVRRLANSLRVLAVVLGIGLLASAPFAHPGANLIEVFYSSNPDLDEVHSLRMIFYRLPLWTGLGFVALLGLKLLDDARDQFDRLLIFMLFLPGFLYFIQDYRLYMLAPGLAILAGTLFRPKTAYLMLAGLMFFNLVGLESPYLTSRRLLYKYLTKPHAPQTIEGIERIPGIGSVKAEEAIPQPPSPAKPEPPAPKPETNATPPAEKQ